MTIPANKSTEDNNSNNKKQISTEFPVLFKFIVQKFITLMKVKANLFFFFMEIQLLRTCGET